MASNISLTKILFAGLVGTFLIATLFGAYSTFIYDNGATIDEPYNTALQEIGSQYSEFESVGKDVSDEGIVKNILDFGRSAITGTVNVFVVGLEAIGRFFTMLPIIGNVASAIMDAVPGLAGVIGLFTIIITIYIGMMYIKSTSNKPDLP